MCHCLDVPYHPRASLRPQRCRHPDEWSRSAAKSGRAETHSIIRPTKTSAAQCQRCPYVRRVRRNVEILGIWAAGAEEPQRTSPVFKARQDPEKRYEQDEIDESDGGEHLRRARDRPPPLGLGKAWRDCGHWRRLAGCQYEGEQRGVISPQRLVPHAVGQSEDEADDAEDQKHDADRHRDLERRCRPFVARQEVPANAGRSSACHVG